MEDWPGKNKFFIQCDSFNFLSTTNKMFSFLHLVIIKHSCSIFFFLSLLISLANCSFFQVYYWSITRQFLFFQGNISKKTCIWSSLTLLNHKCNIILYRSLMAFILLCGNLIILNKYIKKKMEEDQYKQFHDWNASFLK